MSLIPAGWLAIGLAVALLGRAFSRGSFAVLLFLAVIGAVAGGAVTVGFDDSLASGLAGAAVGAASALVLMRAVGEIRNERTA